MSRYVFGPQELPGMLRQNASHFTTGYLRFNLRTPDQPEADEVWMLAFYRGRLIFSADQPLGCKIFLQRLSRFIPRLKLGWSRRALRVIQERLMRENSLRELIEGMTQLALLKPGEVEDALWLNLMTDFDRYLYDRSGTCRFEVHDILARETPIAGYELDPCLQQAAERRDLWTEVKVAISTMMAVPVMNWERLSRYKLTEEQRQKLHNLTKDGETLEAISTRISRDRLEVAQLFAPWVRKGLVSLQTPTEILRLDQRALKTILAVDDSVVMQEMLRQTLPDYRVITTGNPSELLNLLFQHKPDLLVMDVTMPGIDGLELCRIVRNLEEFKTIPVVMLTSRDGFFDRVKGKLSGATAYLTKPIDEVKLNAEVEKLLNLRPSVDRHPPRMSAATAELPTEWSDPLLNPSTEF
ncbi:MAG: response regulator [Synechococcaceae cyanobacterium SM2_3_1]|nr:response regulator [Synechococcaceae cyanobacterium SM2_3_1]